MAIRTRTSDGYQQVELTQELLHSQTGATQQVISTVPCRKHLPFFFSILLADIFTFGSVLLFALYANQYGDGFGFERSSEMPYRQFNLHALIMLTAFVYLNGQAITVYKSNYLVKHKSVNMLYHFLLHLLIIAGIVAGVYMAFEAQDTLQGSQQSRQKGAADSSANSAPKVSHFYSIHSWVGLITIGLFTIQFLFGFCGFLVTLCCRKVTARLRSRAQPIRKMLTIIVLCVSIAAVISGLSQLARFELNGQDGKDNYRDLGTSSLLINLSAVSVIAATILIFFITYTFKRRQAHDLPVLFKIILLVTQFVEFVLILVVAEFIFQLVTPHVHKAINSSFIGNTSLTHIINNATDSIHQIYQTAKKQFTSDSSSNFTTESSEPSSSSSTASILLGSSNLTN